MWKKGVVEVSPELPLMLCDDIDSEQQVRHGVRGDAVPDVACADHQPGDHAEPHERSEQFAGVHQHRDGGADDDGGAVYIAEWNFPPAVALDEPHQETA